MELNVSITKVEGSGIIEVVEGRIEEEDDKSASSRRGEDDDEEEE